MNKKRSLNNKADIGKNIKSKTSLRSHHSPNIRNKRKNKK